MRGPVYAISRAFDAAPDPPPARDVMDASAANLADDTRLGLRPAAPTDVPLLIDLLATTERPVAERVRVWDEARERARLTDAIEAGRAEVVTFNGAPIGLLVVESDPHGLTIECLRLWPVWQRKGIGTRVLAGLVARAERERLPLSVRLRKLDPSAAFFEGHGFVTAAETMLAVDLVRRGH